MFEITPQKKFSTYLNPPNEREGLYQQVASINKLMLESGYSILWERKILFSRLHHRVNHYVDEITPHNIVRMLHDVLQEELLHHLGKTRWLNLDRDSLGKRIKISTWKYSEYITINPISHFLDLTKEFNFFEQELSYQLKNYQEMEYIKNLFKKYSYQYQQSFADLESKSS
jgi:hypothetical protein